MTEAKKEEKQGAEESRDAAKEDRALAGARLRIVGENERGERLELYALEETKLNGRSYLLAADSAEGDGDCYLLKEVSEEDGEEVVYEFVENEAEASCMLNIFRELMSEEGVVITE